MSWVSGAARNFYRSEDMPHIHLQPPPEQQIFYESSEHGGMEDAEHDEEYDKENSDKLLPHT